MGGVNDEYSFINEDVLSKKNGNLSLFKNRIIGNSLKRYTSDSDDCGLDSESMGIFL